MKVSLSVQLPRDVGSVPFARSLLRQALEHVEVAPDVVEDLALALTEACANVVRHAGVDDDYEVRVELDATACRVSVLDGGGGLDLDAEPPAAPGSLLDGGQGLHLVRQRVDALASERTPDGRHRLVLEKRLVPVPTP